MSLDQATAERKEDEQGLAAATVEELQKDLISVAAKWDTVGIYLNIPQDALDNIKVKVTSSSNSRAESCFIKVINAWLNGPKEKVTVAVLAEAVKLAGYGNLARNLLKEGQSLALNTGTVAEKLNDCKAQYSTLGLHLGVSISRIEEFETMRGDAAVCLSHMLKHYLSNCEPSVHELCKALKLAGRHDVSRNIMEKYHDKVKNKDKHPVQKTLPMPEVLPYQESKFDYFPHSEGSKVKMDGSDSKIVFEQYNPWPKDDRLKEVKMSFGAVKPIQGEKKTSIAGMYDMPKWWHGICVVINNEQFSEHSTRDGTNLDECNLVQTFRHLGYLVEVHRDCNAAKMRDIFENMRKRDHSQYDSFVCCIMSHGDAGYIYGSDSMVLPLESITDRFKGEKCETLKGKPKMFFMQACRGLNKDKAVRVAKDSGEESSTTVIDPEQIVSDSENYTIPNSADFFFSYATPLNHVAWRDLDNGSWYVSELCISLTSYGTFSSLVDMVTRTNGQVAKKYSTQGFKQEPEFKSTLGKDVFFF